MPTFTIDENAPIIVEFTPQPGVRQVKRTSPQDIAEQSAKALDSAMNSVHHMARRVIDTIDTLTNKPSEVEVSFGLKLDAETGAIIAKAGIEASINVKLKWQRS